MKIKLFCILIAVFTLTFVITSCNKKKNDTSFLCTITGTVIETGTNNSVSGATVTLSPSGKNTYTGTDGRFEFTDLDNNQYTITVQKNGYQTNRKTVTTEAGGTINVIVDLEKEDK